MSSRNVHLLESLEPRIMLSASLAGVAAVETGADKGLSVETMPALATEVHPGQGAENEGLFDGMQPIAEAPQAQATISDQETNTVQTPVASTPPAAAPAPLSDVATPASPDAAGKSVDQLFDSLLIGQGPPVKEATLAQTAGISSSDVKISALGSGATITWLGGSGNWSDNSKWSGGVAPGVDDTAVISATNSFVTLDTNIAVASLQLSAGTLTIGASRTLTLGELSGASAGQITIASTASLTVSGTATMPGTIAVNGGTLNLQGSSSLGTLRIATSGIVNSGATLTIATELRIDTGQLLAAAPAATLNLLVGSHLNLANGAGKTISVANVNVAGTFTWSINNLTVGNGAIWTIKSTAVGQFRSISGAMRLQLVTPGGTSASLINQGSLEVGWSGVSGGSINFVGVDFTNSGTVQVVGGVFTSINHFTQTAGLFEVAGGQVTLSGGFPSFTPLAFNLLGGELRGTGYIDANVINAATVRPGQVNGTRGDLIIARAYTQTTAGRLVIEALGVVETSSGTALINALQVNGTATLNGTLQFTPLTGFASVSGDVASVLKTFSAPVGTFATVLGLDLPAYTITLDAVSDGFELRVLVAPVVATRNWDGGGDGVSFLDPLNWDGDVLPTRLETARIASVTPIAVNLAAPFLAHALILESGVTFTLGATTLTTDADDATPSTLEGVIVRTGAIFRLNGGEIRGPFLNEAGGTVLSDGGGFAGFMTNLGRLEIRSGNTVLNAHRQAGELILGGTGGAALSVYTNFVNEGLMRVIGNGASLTATTSFGFRLPFINKGRLELRASLSLNTAAITNEGTWDQDAVSISFNALNGNGAFYNPGVFNLRNNSNFQVYGGVFTTVFANDGSLWVDATSALSVGGNITQLNASGLTQIDGSVSAQTVYVSGDGYLGGRGEIFANLINAGGTVAPGSKPVTGGTRTAGVLTVSGNYTTQEPSSRLEVHVFGSGTVTIDQLIAVNATLDGQLAVIGRTGVVAPGTALDFLVLSGAGTLTGSFTSTEQSGFDLGTTLTPTIAAGKATLSVTSANPATTYLWLGGDGNWNDPAKWSTGTTPGAGARVSIGSGTVTLNAGTTVNLASFELAGGVLTGGGTLTVANRFLWWGGALAGDVSVATAAAAELSLATQTQENFGGLSLRDHAWLELGGVMNLGFGLMLKVDDGAPMLVFGTTSVVQVTGAVNFALTNSASLTLENKGGLTLGLSLDWSGVTLVNRGTFALDADLKLQRFEQSAGDADLSHAGTVALPAGLLVTGGNFTAPNKIIGDVTVSGGFYRVRSYRGEIEGAFSLAAGGTLVSIFANSEGFGSGYIRADSVSLAGALQLTIEGSADWSPVMRGRYDIVIAPIVTGAFTSVTSAFAAPNVAFTLVTETQSETSISVKINAAQQVVTWLGGDGLWSDPTQWSTGTVPTYADEVHIDSGVVTFDSSSDYVEISDLYVTGGTLTMTGFYPASLSVNNSADISGGTFENIRLNFFGGADFGDRSVGLTGDLIFGEGSELNLYGGFVTIEDATLNFTGVTNASYFNVSSARRFVLGGTSVSILGNYNFYSSVGVEVEADVVFENNFYASGGLQIAPGARLAVGGRLDSYSYAIVIQVEERAGVLVTGRLEVTGEANFDGTLVIAVAGEFTIDSQISLDVVMAENRFLDFAEVSVNGLPEGYAGAFSTVDGITTLTILPVTATSLNWIGADGLGGDGLWSDAANWSEGRAPTSVDNVTIGAGAGVIDLGGAELTVTRFTMAGGTLTGGTLTVTQGGELSGGRFDDATLVIATGAEFSITDDVALTDASVTVDLGATLTLGATTSMTLSGGFVLQVAGTLEVVSEVILTQGRIVLGIGGQAPPDELNGLLHITATGWLKVGGDFEMATDALSRIELELEQVSASAVRSGRIDVTGSATLNDELVVVVLGELDFSGAQSLVLFAAPNSANGTAFATISVPELPAGFVATPTAGGQSISLALSRGVDFTQRVDDFNAGLALVTGRLGAWLQSFNFTAGTFSLLPDELHDLFGLANFVGSIDLPTLDSVPGTLADFQLALDSLGYTVDTLTNDTLQVRLDFNFNDLGVAVGFSGKLLNLVTVDGLGAINDQPSTLPWLADLALTFVLGLDASGFYLGGDTAMSLEIELPETSFDLTGDLAGRDDVALAGTLALAGNVDIVTGNSATRYRGAQITGDPSSVFDPLATFSGELTLDFALPYVSLTSTLAWSVSTDGARVMAMTVNATLTGQLSLPGFKTDDNATDALFILAGTRTAAGWQLVATATGDFKLSGFTVANLVITLDLTPTSYAGSGEGQIGVDGNADLPALVLDFALTLGPAGYEITGTFGTSTITVGSVDPLLWLGNATYTFNAVATGTTLNSALLMFAADDAVLFPDVETLTAPLPTGPIHAENVTGSLSAGGHLQLTAATVEVNLGAGLQIEVDGDVATSTPALALDLNPADTASDAVIATLTGLRVSTPALLLGSLAVMQLQVRRNGFELVASGALDPAARLRVGDPVMLEVTGLTFAIDVVFTAGAVEPVTGEFTLTATQAALFPDLATPVVDGIATLTNLTGSINLETGAVNLAAGTFLLLAGDHLQLRATGTPENTAIHFVWDPVGTDPATTILLVNHLVLTLPGLLDAGATLPTIDLLQVRRNGFELTATFSTPGETLTLGDPTLLTLTSPAFELVLAATRNVSTEIDFAATLTITAASATFTGPPSVGFTLGDDDLTDSVPGVTSVFNLADGAFTLTARHAVFTLGEIVTGEIEGGFVDQDGGSVFVPAVEFSYDPTGPPSAQLLSFAVIEGDLTVLAFNGLAPHATLTGLSVTQGGDWSLSSVSITLPVGYASVHRLGLIPFKLDGISLAFTTPGDFADFDLTVSGRFELAGLSLGFTPVIYIGDPSLIGTGDPALITVRPGDTTLFNFTLNHLALFAGQFTPLNFGPITLGIEGLTIAGITFNGQLGFGAFVDGVFVPLLSGFDLSGFLIITGGTDVPLNARIDLSGNFTFPTLDLSVLELATQFEFDGGALDFDLTFTYTAHLPSAPFFNLSFDAQLNRISLQNIVIEVPDLLRITISEISFTLNPAVGDPVATSTSAILEFLSFPGFGPVSISFIELYKSAGEIDGFVLRNLLLVFSAELETSEGVTLLRLVDPRVVIEEMSYLNGVLAGSLEFDAVAAILLPDVNPNVFTARGEGVDPLARGVTGSFDFATGALSFSADRFSATFGSALEIFGESFTFNYDPTGTDLTAPIVTVGSATATATDFPQLGSGVLTGLVITRGSASFESLTLGPGSANLEDVLVFDALSVAFTDVNYTYATSTLTGTATLTAATATLFTGDAAFAAEARTLTGTFNLAQGLDSLVLTATELEIAVHGHLNLSAEDVTFNFSGDTVATLASVEANLPDFPGLGSATISELVITRDGFTASSAVFGPAQLMRGPLQFSNLTATLDAIAYDRVDGFTAGELSFTADGVVLFPGNIFVNATLVGVKATIRFNDPADQPFTFTAESFLLTAGRALRLEGEQLSLTLGSGNDFTLLVTNARASSPLLPGLMSELNELTVTQAGFTLASLVLDAASGTVAGLLEVTDLRFTISQLIFTAGEPLSGTVAFTATSALLLPALGAIAPRLSDDDTTDDLPGVAGSLDLETGALTIEARRIDIVLGDLIVFEIESSATAPALSFVDDPTAAPDSALLSIATAIATIPVLELNGLSPTVIFTDFGLRRDGRYFQRGAVVDLPAGYPDLLGLGGILPLRITQLALTFPDPDDLNAFTFSVTGTFDLAVLNLPFDPILYIGDPALIGTASPDLITILPGSGASFTLDLDVISLRDGKIDPLNFGPVTLGVENLDLGGTVVSGVIQLGRFEDGVLGPLPNSTANVTGLFTIVSSADSALEINATIELTGNIETLLSGATRLALTGVVSGSGDLGSASGGVEVTFELTLTFTPQDNAPFLTAQVEGRFLSVAFTNITIDLGFVIIHAGRVEAIFNPAPGRAQYILSEISIEFPAYDTLTGTSVDLIEMFSDRFVIEDLTIELTGSLFPDNSFVELIDLEATIDAEVGYVRNGNNFSDFELLSGGVSFTTGELTLFPGSTTFTASATHLSGSLDVTTGELTLTADAFTANVVDVLSLSLLNVELYLGNAPNRPVLQVASATATIPALDDLAFTLTDLSLSRAGAFTLASAALSAPGGILASFGLGGLLPFEITDVMLEFENSRLDQIEITITGTFDFSAFENLPFTPVIRIGSVESTELAPSNFEFTLAIGELALGKISPIDFGPIEIGFSGLEVGSVTLGGTIIFGGYHNGLFVPSIGGSLSLGSEFGNLQGGVGITLIGTYDAVAHRLSVSASFGVSFTLNDTIDVTNAALTFNFAFSLGAGPIFTLDTLSFAGASIERVDVRFSDLFVFTATSVSIDFNPAPDGLFATFGSLTVAFPGIGGLGGSAGNFGIRADFSFATLPGFFVTLTPPSPELFGFPDWLPVSFEAITLQFADIEHDPLNVAITLTASIDSATFPLPISGRVEGLTIDIGMLRAGKFPITNLDAFAIEFGPIGFGGLQLSGLLALGIAALDASGNLLEGLDAQNDVLVAQRVLFGLIEGSVAVPGIGGLTIRLGLSEFGPLVIFVSAEIPILLDPTSGLTLYGLRGGVRFGAEFPSIIDTETNLPDPELLRDPAFSPSGDLTTEQWLAALREQIATIARSGVTSGQVSFATALSAPMLIELGGSLGSTYLPGLTAEVDIIISTEGALLMSGVLQYFLPGVMDAPFVLGEAKFFIDLRQIESGSVDIVFLLDVPADPAILSISGFLSFDIVFNAQNEATGFTLVIGGKAEIAAIDVRLVGLLKLTVTTERTEIFVDASLEYPVLGPLNAQGLLILDYSGDKAEVWGALSVSISQSANLGPLGIAFDAGLTVQFNVSDRDQAVQFNFANTGEVIDVVIPANSFALFANGFLYVKSGNDTLFAFDGVFIIEIAANEGLTIFVEASLIVGAAGPNAPPPLLQFSALGFLKLSTAGLAGKIDVTLETNFPASMGLELGGSFLLIVNTTGQTVTYTPPPIPGSQQQPSSVSIPGRLTPQSANGVYAMIEAQGYLSVLGLRLEGTFGFALSADVLRVTASATLDISIAGARLLTVSIAGGFQIDRTGMVASLSVTLAAGSNSSDYAFGASLQLVLSVNTTGLAVTQIGSLPVNLAAGRYARLMVTGSLNILGLSLTGTYAIEAGTNGYAIAASATLKLVVANVEMFSFNVLGALQFGPRGFAAKFALSLGAQNTSGSGGSFSAAFVLEINTGNAAVPAIAGVSVNLEAGPYARITALGSLTVGGLELAGSFIFTMKTDFIALDANISLALMAGSTQIINLAGRAVMEIRSNGFVGLFQLSLSVNTDANVVGFRLAGVFQLEINTTSSARVFAGGRPVLTLSTGEIVSNQMQSLTIEARTVRVYLAGSFITVVNSAEVLRLQGSFEFTAGTSLVSVRASAFVKVGPLDLLQASGVFEIRSNGVAAVLSVASGGSAQSTGGNGFSFSGSFQLELNTRSTSVTLTNARAKVDPATGLTLPGQFENVTIAARSFTLVVTGGLNVAVLGNEVDLFGRFELRLSASDLLVTATAVLDLTVGNARVFAFAASGALLINSNGIAASLTLTLRAGGGPQSSLGFAFNASASFLLKINTTSAARATIGGVTVSLPAGPYVRVEMTGALQVGGLSLEGSFGFSGGATEVTVTASFSLELEVAGVRVFSFTGSGALRITQTGLAASLTLLLQAGPASSLGFSLTGGVAAKLLINTTGAAVTRIGSQAVSLEGGADYAEVTLDATFAILGVEFDGTFGVRVSTAGLAIAANATFSLNSGDTRILQLSVTGGFLINSRGIAAKLSVSLRAGTSSTLGFSFGGNLSFGLELNTTGQAVSSIAGVVVNLPGGADYLRVTVSGNLVFAGSFTLEGAFVLSVVGSQVDLSVNARIDVGPFANLDVDGSLRITPSGIAGFLDLEAGARFSRNGVGFSFDARLRLEINTTGVSQTLARIGVNQTTGAITSASNVTIAARTVRVVLAGSITLGGTSDLFKINGWVVLTFGSSSLQVAFDAGFVLFGTRVSVDGSGGLYYGSNPGLAFRIRLYVGSNDNPNLSGSSLFSFTGTFMLEVNTRGVTSNGVSPNTVRVSVTDARVTVAGFTLSGSLIIGVSSGVFSVTIPSSDPLTLRIWNFVTLSFSGSFRSSGYLSLTASASVRLGSNDWNVHGSFTVSFTYNDGAISFRARLAGGATVAGFDINFGTISINSNGVARFGTFLGDVIVNFRTGGIGFDGPVAGALIVFDANRNGIYDEGEPVTYTNDLGEYFFENDLLAYDANGNGLIDEAEGDLLSIGGRDVLTGLLVAGMMRGSAAQLGTGFGIAITPLTTLTVTLRDFGYDQSAAEALILGRLFGTTLVDQYLSFGVGNPYDGTIAGTAHSAEVFQNNALLVGTMTPIAALLDAAGVNLDRDAATAAAYRAVAMALLAQPNGLDLSNATVIADVINRAAQIAGVSLDASLVTATAAALAALNTSLLALDPATDANFASDVLRHQIVAQDDLTAFATAGNQTALNQAATATGLANLLSGATLPATDYPTDIGGGTFNPEGRTLFSLDSVSPVVAEADGSYRVTVFNRDITTNPRNQLVVQRVIIDATIYDAPVTLQLRSSADGYQRVIATIELSTDAVTNVITLAIPLAVPVGGLGFVLTPVGAVDATTFSIDRITVEGFVLEFFSGVYADYLSGHVPTFAQFFANLPLIRNMLTGSNARFRSTELDRLPGSTFALEAARLLNAPAQSTTERLQTTYSTLINGL